MKNKSIFALLLSLVLGLVSCEPSFLDEEMTTSLGSESVFKTTGDYEMALIGVYDMLGTRSFPTLDQMTAYYCNYNGGIMVLNEFSTDEMCLINGPQNKQLYIEELDKCQPTALNHVVKCLYSGQYATIDRANDLIWHAEQLSNPDKTIVQCVAEAKFIRALTYYNLVTLFGGVVLVEVPGSERVGQIFPRSSTEAVYDFIFKDLEEAYNILPASFANEKQLGRATKIAAAALMARTKLTAATMGKYAKITPQLALEDGINSYAWAKEQYTELLTDAITYAQKVIDEGYGAENALLSMEYEKSFYPYENTPEIIFDVQFKDGLSQDEGGWVGWISGPGSWNHLRPTGFTGNLYKPNGGTLAENFPTPASRSNCDIRKYKNITNGNYYKNSDGVYVLWPPLPTNKQFNLGKFAMEQDYTYPKQSSPINYPILRLAEVYLIIAEADAELNNRPTELSFKMVNYVRRRAAMVTVLPDLNETNIYDANVVDPVPGITPQNSLQAFRLALLQERMFEFIGESLRRTDLIRYGWMEEMLEKCNTIDFDKVQYIKNRRRYDEHFLFYPIPSREVTLSNNIIKQNFGY